MAQILAAWPVSVLNRISKDLWGHQIDPHLHRFGDLKHHKLGVEIDPNRKPFPCHMILREPVLPAM